MPKRLSSQHSESCQTQAAMVDAAKDLKDLQRPPNNKLHALGKDRKAVNTPSGSTTNIAFASYGVTAMPLT